MVARKKLHRYVSRAGPIAKQSEAWALSVAENEGWPSVPSPRRKAANGAAPPGVPPTPR